MVLLRFSLLFIVFRISRSMKKARKPKQNTYVDPHKMLFIVVLIKTTINSILCGSTYVFCLGFLAFFILREMRKTMKSKENLSKTMGFI